MSIRGRRSHSHVRRLDDAASEARAAVDVEIAETPLADADRLIATFRVRAYPEARRRQRRGSGAGSRRPLGPGGEPHRAARGRIARRRIVDADRAGRQRRSSRSGAWACVPPSDFSRLTRWTSSNAFSPSGRNASGFSSLASAPITARPFLPKPKSKPRTPPARSAKPSTHAGPPRAVGLRLLDLEGREIFERLKADLR